MKSTLTLTTPTRETSFPIVPAIRARPALRTQLAVLPLRAFAVHVNVDHSTLSQWLRGRRPMTRRSIETLGETLGLSTAAIQGYVERAQRESDDGPFRTASFLTSETVALIADWYHFAILELTRLSEFRADSRWIAARARHQRRRSERRPAAAHPARPPRHGVHRSLGGHVRRGVREHRFADARRRRRTADAEPTSRLSAAAVRHVPMTLREHTSITLAVNSAALPRAFELCLARPAATGRAPAGRRGRRRLPDRDRALSSHDAEA